MTVPDERLQRHLAMKAEAEADAARDRTFEEFKEMYLTHAHPIGTPEPEEGKLLALFNLFDVQSRGKVAKVDFIATLQRTKPALPLVDRLSSKVRKGGQRLVRALTEEF